LAAPNTIYAQAEVGAARIVAEVPVSDGSTALEILNFRKTQVGSLESRFRLLPLINPGLVSASIVEGVPDMFSEDDTHGCLGVGYMDWNGTVPEMLFLTRGGCRRYTPWLRPSAPNSAPLTTEQYYFNGDTESAVRPQAVPYFPPQLETIGNRVYFTFCDGGGAWVWDRERLRPFGFTRTPSAPSAQGPSPNGDDEPNAGGFSAGGRIGTIESDWTRVDDTAADDVQIVVGGIDDGKYDYRLVLEGPDGAYSATSTVGGSVTIRKELAALPNSTAVVGDKDYGRSRYPERLRFRFRVQNIDPGPPSTAARILLRTANQRRLPPGDDGLPRFLHRLPGGSSQEYIDDIPDSELGAPWQDREQTPGGFYLLKSFGGSLFMARTEGAPSRVWWSEQGAISGPTPESILKGHWRDVYPNTGAITALHPVYLNNGSTGPTLLVFKETAAHYLNGQYPGWGVGTLHDQAGCAGPGCVQSLPDGTIVWYGNHTFWRMDRDGGVTDIGGPIKKHLALVNHSTARSGVSFINMDSQEAFFCLPYGEAVSPNFMFIWDWQLGGFRFMDQMTEVLCAARIPNSDMTLVSGTYDDTRNLWIWDRSNYVSGSADDERDSYAGVNAAVYQSGWNFMDDSGLRNAYHINSLVVAGQHAYEGTGTVATYRNYDRRASTITEENTSLTLASPQDTSVVFWSDTDAAFDADNPAVDDDVYPENAPYYCRVAADSTDTDVICVKLTIPAKQVIDLLGITVYGMRQASSGRRVERTSESAT
jgi:hypothetical protein